LSEYKIAESILELRMAEGELREINVNGKNLCIMFSQGKLFGCASSCPHAGGKMSRGYIDAMGNIVCPVHRYRFNMKNGYNSSGEGYHLKTYQLESREDGVWVIDNR
jgi:3-phenylpropionate/trans-cinnamate dioxygenase ferredoxin subunit